MSCTDFLLRSEKGSGRQCVMMHSFSLRMEKGSLLCHDALVFFLELKKGSPMCHALIFF